MALFDGSAEFISILRCILALYVILAGALAAAQVLGHGPDRKQGGRAPSHGISATRTGPGCQRGSRLSRNGRCPPQTPPPRVGSS